MFDIELVDKVLAGEVVPSAPECRFYDNNTNFTSMNATEVFVPPSLVTTLKHFTISFKSIWKEDFL